MAAPAILKIDIIADASKAQKALGGTGKAAESSGKKLAGLAKAAAGGFAVAKVFEFGKASVKAAQDSELATSRLEAVYKSMGDTTGEAAKGAENFAGALSRKIGVDDEAIMSAQALLATFSNVSNEAGRQSGIFDRATSAAADLAAAGFGDLDSNAKQLGKALQDPVKGITALTKSGVTFTQAQKDQIAQMMKSGDVLGAQKIVMGEVEHQVKGTAAATATGASKMKVAFGETSESLGKALLPALEALAPILATVADFIAQNISWILPIAAAFGIWAVATWAMTAAQTAFGISLGISVGWIALIVVAIAALVVGIIWAYKNVGWFRAIVQGAFAVIMAVFNAFKVVVLAVMNAAGAAFRGLWGVISAVFGWIRSNWPLLLAIIAGPIGIAVLMIIRNWDTLKNAATVVWEWIRGAFQNVVDFIASIPSKIGAALSGIGEIIMAPFRGAFNAIAGFWNRTVGALSFTIPGWVPGLGGKGFDVPDMPTLMYGGTVARTGLAVVHAGERYSGVGAGARAFGAGPTTVNITVNTDGLGASSPQVQRSVANALRAYTRRNGPLNIAVTGRP